MNTRVKIDDTKIISKLNVIRRRVDGRNGHYVPPPIGTIDRDLHTTDEVKGVLQHRSGVLIYNGQPVFAYIRDHTIGGPYDTPEEMRKLHFTVCQTLQEMDKTGRFQRYRVTNRQDNRYVIDVMHGWNNTMEKNVPLYPCQHCLKCSGYRCFDWRMTASEKKGIIQKFDAKEAYRLMRRQFDAFNDAIKERKLKSATLSSSYPKNWKALSQKCRERSNYTCGQCGVCLKSNPRYLDAHHIDGDKTNIHHDNLTCLCKLCHAEKHPHYVPSADCRHIIKSARAHPTLF